MRFCFFARGLPVIAWVAFGTACGARSGLGILATNAPDATPALVRPSDGGATPAPDATSLPDAFVLSDAPATSPGTCVLVGADIDVATSNTWIWSGTAWSQRSPQKAITARAFAASAAQGDSVVVFGGYGVVPNGTTYVDDTWTWDGVTWHEQTPTVSPSARDAAAAATLNGTVYLFGGESNAAVFGDTWTWDGSSWTELSPAASPTARSGASFATLGNTIVLFGGTVGQFGTAKLVNDTWTWDGTTWTEVAPAVSPSPRHAAAMARVGTNLVLFGGQTDASDESVAYLSDTWTWDGSVWTELKPATSPPARGYASFGSTGDAMVVSGGLRAPPPMGKVYLEDTWVWDGTAWTEITTTQPSGLDTNDGTMACF